VRARPARGDGAGFTLIEVLVAAMILAVAVLAALQLFGGGLRLLRGSADHAAAALLASAKLAELPSGAVEEGVEEGTEGVYRWARRVVLEPALLPLESGTPEAAALALARVTVEVRWGAGRQVEMTTLRAWVKGP
jgi:prepilin-type N-terminal cleavage/methylation domain-containing protein